MSQLPVDVDKLFVRHCFSSYILTYSSFTMCFCRLCSHSCPGKFARGGLCPSCYGHFALLPEVLLHGFWVTQNPAADWFWSPKRLRSWQATATLIKGLMSPWREGKRYRKFPIFLSVTKQLTWTIKWAMPTKHESMLCKGYCNLISVGMFPPGLGCKSLFGGFKTFPYRVYNPNAATYYWSTKRKGK